MKEYKILMIVGFIIAFVSNWNLILMEESSIEQYIFGNGLMLSGYVVMYYVGLKQYKKV